jgi:predicted chitinase
MSTNNEVNRKWDELADRGDLRTVTQRINYRFDRIERLHWIQIIAIVCGLIAISLK